MWGKHDKSLQMPSLRETKQHKILWPSTLQRRHNHNRKTKPRQRQRIRGNQRVQPHWRRPPPWATWHDHRSRRHPLRHALRRHRRGTRTPRTRFHNRRLGRNISILKNRWPARSCKGINTPSPASGSLLILKNMKGYITNLYYLRHYRAYMRHQRTRRIDHGWTP
ncbi:hypothetical protein LCGC14_2780880 [marine sediment metagenome]|uniref:Uncharacterized protein n=1 Tax=marine sediment metagenome TaxID=412755 RepID=A0A0F8V9W3_9ZZZZ